MVDQMIPIGRSPYPARASHRKSSLIKRVEILIYSSLPEDLKLASDVEQTQFHYWIMQNALINRNFENKNNKKNH